MKRRKILLLVSLITFCYNAHAQFVWDSLISPSGNVVDGFGFGLNGQLFASNSTGMWRTTNGGNTWILINHGLATIRGYPLILTNSKGHIFLDAPRLFRSWDNGDSWLSIFEGVFSFFVTSGDTLYASSSSTIPGNGIYISTDEGNNWSLLKKDYIIVGINSKRNFFAYSPNLDTLLRSTDGGVGWSCIFAAKDGGAQQVVNYRDVSSVGVYLDTKDNIFFSFRNGANSTGPAALFRSTDNGDTWVNLNFTTEVVSWANGLNGEIYVRSFQAKSLFRSYTSGNTWENISGNLPNGGMYAIGVSPSNVLYVSLYGSKIFKYSPPTDVEAQHFPVPVLHYRLDLNFPNPFNPATMVAFELPERSHVRLRILDILGRVVAELVNKDLEAGYYSQVWNAIDLPSGVYICQVEATSITNVRKRFTKATKMLLLK